MAATVGVGPLVKEWRGRRRRSQLDLALEVGVSARHLSFVETGRSKPSPELVLTLADHLDVPLRERNTLLLAAGYAPRYRETPLHDPSMDQVRASLDRLLAAHDPYPGVVIDAHWDVVVANQAAGLLTALLPPTLAGPPLNVFRACLHPDGLARLTRNLEPWADLPAGRAAPDGRGHGRPGAGRPGAGDPRLPEPRRRWSAPAAGSTTPPRPAGPRRARPRRPGPVAVHHPHLVRHPARHHPRRARRRALLPRRRTHRSRPPRPRHRP